MAFFDADGENGGKIKVSTELWWYFAITIPVTCIVFAFWIMWKKYRIGRFINDLDKAQKE